MKITQVEWVPVGKAVAKDYSKDDIPGLAAELAYWIIFSIFPFFIFLATLAGLIGQMIGIDNIMQNITNSLYSALDSNTAETLRGVLATILTPGGGALSFGAVISAVLALNSASTAVSTMMKAFNRAYGVEETRNFIVAKLIALGLTLALVILLIGGSILLTAGGGLAKVFNLGAVGTAILFVMRIVGAIVGISLGLAILYWKGPNIKQQFVWISPGAILATITIIIFSALFGLYVSFFAGASFNKTYGTIAGAIIFLFFLRIVSTLVLVGAAFNAESARRYDPETIRDKITDPAKQLPGKQPMPHPQAVREAGMTQQQIADTNTSSAQKLAHGSTGPTTANMPQVAAMKGSEKGGANGFSYDESSTGEPSLDERLRAIRERPYRSAVAEARRVDGHSSPQEHERRTKTALATLGIAAVAAVGAAIAGAGGGRAA